MMDKVQEPINSEESVSPAHSMLLNRRNWAACENELRGLSPPESYTDLWEQATWTNISFQCIGSLVGMAFSFRTEQ
jgi:hypothetical protein